MLFNRWNLPGVQAPNRLVRAATYEGLGDVEGYPQAELGSLYARLAACDVGTIITGFAYVSRAGRAMQPRQCGIDTDEKVSAWRRVVSAVRAVGKGTLLVMQIAHAGRQTLASATGGPVLAPSPKRSPYFRAKPEAMSDEQIRAAIGAFVDAALRAKQAGFDGVELHAAHGYLIHQFLSPHLNQRGDRWGRDRMAFLREIVTGIRAAGAPTLPILVKISAGDFHPGGVDEKLAASIAAQLADLGVDALEVSCGTMDLAMNIFRGSLPLERAFAHNPLFAAWPAWQRAFFRLLALPRIRRQLLPFSENYNRRAARLIRRHTDLPLILVGGIRSLAAIEDILESGDADAVAMCRPLICEPDLGARFHRAAVSRSSCNNCNTCAVMCDSTSSLRCYRKEAYDEAESHL
jgi:2,4-dienoyl-CoA reductase-like NADH-dependent reductase (Old Yellow Enzyme family)